VSPKPQPAPGCAEQLSSTFHRRLLWLLSGAAIIESVNPRVIGARRAALVAPAGRVAAMIAMAGLALPAAGCGGSRGSQVAQLGSTTTQSDTSSSAAAPASALEGDAIAFSSCMRSHGVSKFPDPSIGGRIPKVGLEELGVSGFRFETAQRACRHLLPNGGAGPDAAQLRQARAQALSYAECVRRHGVTNFPDPGSDGRIPDPATVGIDQGSPKFEAANQACSKYRPPYMPSNAAYHTWARQHG
jgi:hypothetical protein